MVENSYFEVDGNGYYICNGRVYDENDNTAILISPGFGCSWSVEESNNDLLFMPEMVRYILEGGDLSLIDEKHEIFKDLENPPEYISLGKLKLRIRWIPVGKIFRIMEYDGNEYVEYYNPDDYCTTISRHITKGAMS